METTTSNSGPPCPVCQHPRRVTDYKTKRQRKGQRRYVHTTCGKPACKRQVMEKKRALTYLEGRP